MGLGSLFQIIGALNSPNRPAGIGGIATAVSSPATLLGMDLEQDVRKKYAAAVEEPDIKAFRNKGMEQAMLGNMQGVFDAQQQIGLELQKRGLNPDNYFKTEGYIAQTIARQADAVYKGNRGAQDEISKRLFAGAGGPQEVMGRANQALGAGMLTPKTYDAVAGTAAGQRGSQLVAGQPLTASALQQSGGQLAGEQFPYNAIPGGLRGGQPGVVDFNTKFNQERALAEMRQQMEQQYRYNPTAIQGEGAISGARATGNQMGQLGVQSSPFGLQAQGAITANDVSSRVNADLAARANAGNLHNQAAIDAAQTGAREAARLAVEQSPQFVTGAADRARQLAAGQTQGREQTKIDIQTEPGNLQRILEANAQKAGATTAAREQAQINVQTDPSNLQRIQEGKADLIRAETMAREQGKQQMALRNAQTIVDGLKDVFGKIQGQLPKPGYLNKLVAQGQNRIAKSSNTNPDLIQAEALGNAALGVLGRALGGQLGNLTEQEQQRISGLVPTDADTKQVVAAKLNLMDYMIMSRSLPQGQGGVGDRPFLVSEILPPSIETTSQAVTYFQQQFGMDEEAARRLVQSLSAAEGASTRAYQTPLEDR